MNLSLNLKFKKILFYIFIIMSMVIFINPGNELQADTSKNIKIRPDISFHKVSISRVGITAMKDHKIKLKVSVKNFSPVKTCTGPFKIKVEWRNNKKRPFILLSQAGVSNLCFDPKNKKSNIVTRYFEHLVKSGKTNFYKITIDPLSQVNESNEGNNIIYKDYTAVPMISAPVNMNTQINIEDRLPSCEGIDLIIKNVEVIRNTSGNIFIKATIKNLCTGSCTGPIIIEVDESDVLGRPGGIEQQIGSGIGSKAEYTMGSALGIANDSSRTCSYTISVRTEGGCTEPHGKTGNNTFRITIDPI